MLGRIKFLVQGWLRRSEAGQASQPGAQPPSATNSAPGAAGEALEFYNLALSLMKSGEHDEAALNLQRALDLAPDFHPALNSMGILLRQQGKPDEAAAFFEQAIEAKYDYADAHNNLGLSWQDRGKSEDAADCFHLAIHYNPNLIEAYFNLGLALQSLERYQEAAAIYCRLLEVRPDDADAHLNLGNALKFQGDLDGAARSYETALKLKPGYAEALCNLGLVLFRQGRFDEAKASYQKAIAAKADLAEVYYNLGLLLRETGEIEKAVSQFRRALAIKPGLIEAECGLAHALRDLGRFDKALQHYDWVLRHQPENGEALLNKAYTRLMMGDYQRGWADYERRMAAAEAPPRDFGFPAWDGSPPGEKKILVFAEQGLGDEIMFASCLPDLISASGKCVIECNTRLAPIFIRSFDAAVHGGKKDEDPSWVSRHPGVAFQISLGSLPYYFRKKRSDFPAHRGYLKAGPEYISLWRSRLDALGAGLKVGISWRGGTFKTRGFLRSIELQEWLPMLALKNVQFISLQYTDCLEEIGKLKDQHGIVIHHWQEAIDDLDQTAALISALDLVISVDNSAVHLSGALGKAVWILLSAGPEWRYGLEGGALPWYPSARLFRQSLSLQWKPVIERAAQALTNQLKQLRPG